MPLRGCFVTGTDTGVGKTVVAASIAASLVARGVRTAAFKPVATGLDEPAGDWPHDHTLLASVTGMRADEVSPIRLGAAAAPPLAARLEGREIDLGAVATAFADVRTWADAVVVEGAGGLLMPLTSAVTMRDLAATIGLPLVIAARPGLGALNHVLLTVEAARAVGLEVRAVVLTPWPAQPGHVQRSNLETIARMTGLEVALLPKVAAPLPELLERAGSALRYERWLGWESPVDEMPGTWAPQPHRPRGWVPA